MSQFCRAIGTSRQNVYQRLQKAEAEWQATQSLRYMVDAVRRDHPRMGMQILYTRLCPGAHGTRQISDLVSGKRLFSAPSEKLAPYN